MGHLIITNFVFVIILNSARKTFKRSAGGKKYDRNDDILESTGIKLLSNHHLSGTE